MTQTMTLWHPTHPQEPKLRQHIVGLIEVVHGFGQDFAGQP